MTAECGLGREIISPAVGSGSGKAAGMDMGASSGMADDAASSSFVAEVKGWVFVGALSIMEVISSGTRAGVTFSMMLKDGNSSTVVGSE